VKRNHPARLWLLLSACLLGTPPAWAATFGETNTGGILGVSNYNRLTACRYSAGEDGDVNRILVYVNPAVGSMRVALYDNTLTPGGNSLPGTLLAESSPVATALGWVTFAIPQTTVAAGRDYWLAFQVNDSTDTINTRAFSDLHPQRTLYWASFAWNVFPAILYPDSTPDFQGAYRYSMYATLITPTPTPSATPTFTSSITRTLTRTVTPTRTPTATPTASVSATCTATPPWTVTLTPTRSASATPTSSPRPTASATPTATARPSAPIVPGRLLVFPNPASGPAVSLGFLAAGPGTARFAVYNAAYQLVESFTRSVPAAGPRVEAWDIQRLAPGVYLFRLELETGGGRQVLPVCKLVVQK